MIYIVLSLIILFLVFVHFYDSKYGTREGKYDKSESLKLTRKVLIFFSILSLLLGIMGYYSGIFFTIHYKKIFLNELERFLALIFFSILSVVCMIAAILKK